MYKLDKILRTATQYHASDVYISTGSKPIIRINGDLVIINDHPVLTKKIAEEYLLEIMTEEQRKIFEKSLELDFSLEAEGVARFRVNILCRDSASPQYSD